MSNNRVRNKSKKFSNKDLRKKQMDKIPVLLEVMHDEKGTYYQPFSQEIVEVPEQEEVEAKIVRVATEAMQKDEVHQAEISAGKSNKERRLAFLDGKLQKLITGGGATKVGVTRAKNSKSKNSLIMEKKSRSKNAQIAKKVRRATGSKKRK